MWFDPPAMKWKKGTKSRDVIDIRGASKGSSGSGGGPQLPIPGGLAGKGGAAGLIIVLIVVGINVLGGGNGSSGGFDLPGAFGLDGTAPGADNPQPLPPGEDPQADLKDFSSYVFDDTQDVWEKSFAAGGDPYDTAKLVLYSGAVQTDGCGSATSAVGPFYCPADERVYLDLSFYEDMKRQLGASGDFAWAYVIAHEMGHHVQRMTGTSGEVDRLSRSDPGEANELSVRQELQADCYAGVWAIDCLRRGRPRARRPRRGLQRGRGGRRRSPSAAGHRPGRPRQLHPRHLRAAALMVRARLRVGRPRRLRHVLGRDPLDNSEQMLRFASALLGLRGVAARQGRQVTGGASRSLPSYRRSALEQFRLGGADFPLGRECATGLKSR